jgi:rhodanese-related sulfurtransferase
MSYFWTINNKTNKMNLENIIRENKGTILDVRSEGEFIGGNVAGSLNIPVQELMERLDEVKQMEAPLVLCCASGNRSGMAQQMLSAEGIECYNGGGWMEVNSYKN